MADEHDIKPTPTQTPRSSVDATRKAKPKPKPKRKTVDEGLPAPPGSAIYRGGRKLEPEF